MGVISQLEDGHFYLEDLTASVEINLSNTISFTQCYLQLKNYFMVLKVCTHTLFWFIYNF